MSDGTSDVRRGPVRVQCSGPNRATRLGVFVTGNPLRRHSGEQPFVVEPCPQEHGLVACSIDGAPHDKRRRFPTRKEAKTRAACQ